MPKNVCKCYNQEKQVRYLTDFEKGILFAKTGQYVDSVEEAIGRCFGTKECDVCLCKGNELNCDFYPEKRKIN